jgi:molybdenum cofactor guanylyltransferase
VSARVVGIVLAGGASSRFGRDKLSAPLDGRPLLDHALVAIAGVSDHVVLVLAPDAAVPPIPPSLVGRLSIARDPVAHRGPLAGLAAALHAARAIDGDPGDIAVVAGGDMPTLVPAVLRLLVDALEADDRVVAATLAAASPSPLPMVIRVVASRPADALLEHGRRSLLALLDAVPAVQIAEARWRMVDPAGATLRDIDTPGDLEEAGDPAPGG